MHRNALVKGLEMPLKQSGKLLRRKLKDYFASGKEANTITFKELFRNAFKHSLLSGDEVNRRMKYRDNRNNTALDNGRAFAEQTLCLIANFIKDVKHLKEVIANG